MNALTTNVFLFNETTTTTTLHSIRDLVGFVESFANDQGYSSARNVPGNVQVEFTGPATARVQSSTVSAHFLTRAAASGSRTIQDRTGQYGGVSGRIPGTRREL